MSVKNTYRLINPYIEGSLDTLVRAKNSFSAGKHLYNNVSKYFTNHVENFTMAIQNVETKDVTHFNISERRRKNNAVDYDIIKLNDALPSTVEESLLKKIDEMDKQVGGRKKDDESHSSSSSSESDTDFFYKNNTYLQPISRFTYFSLPYIYHEVDFIGININDYMSMSNETYKSLFMPVFCWPISPVVHVRLDCCM